MSMMLFKIKEIYHITLFFFWKTFERPRVITHKPLSVLAGSTKETEKQSKWGGDWLLGNSCSSEAFLTNVSGNTRRFTMSVNR